MPLTTKDVDNASFDSTTKKENQFSVNSMLFKELSINPALSEHRDYLLVV